VKDVLACFTDLDLSKQPPAMREQAPGPLEVKEVVLYEGYLIKIYVHSAAQGKEGMTFFISHVFFSDIDIDKKGQNVHEKIDDCQKEARTQNNFRSRLVNNCQNEFQNATSNDRLYNDLEDKRAGIVALAKSRTAAGINDEQEAEFKAEIEEISGKMLKMKQRMLGNIRFVGELYKKVLFLYVRQYITLFIGLACRRRVL
jgi:hypothetical protein